MSTGLAKPRATKTRNAVKTRERVVNRRPKQGLGLAPSCENIENADVEYPDAKNSNPYVCSDRHAEQTEKKIGNEHQGNAKSRKVIAKHLHRESNFGHGSSSPSKGCEILRHRPAA
jgi:hypothetical protein